MTRGIHCHSGFRHYEMFHSGGCGYGGSNYGSIFNTTYNISCGGHSGFWSGVGYGLGNFLGGMFGNMFGGMGNMFGGGMFGMGNMFGGLGNMFGGFGMPFANFWGGGGGSYTPSTSTTCTCGCKNKKTEKDTETTKAECTDPDRQKLVDFGKKVNAAQENKDLTAKELKALYDEIKAAQTASKDEAHHKETDPDDYQNWLDNLKLLSKAKGWGDPESPDFGKVPDTDSRIETVDDEEITDNDDIHDNEGITDSDDVTDNDDGSDSNNTIKIDGTNVPVGARDDILKLTKAQISKLTDAQAKDLLKKLGIEEESQVKANDLINRTVLRLLDKVKINVKLGQNLHQSATDHFIIGQISLIDDDDDSKPIKYTVDGTKYSGNTQKNVYTFTQTAANAKSFDVKFERSENGARLAKSDVQTVTYEAKENEEYLTRDGYKYTTLINS